MLVIGGGIAGTSVLRELSKYELETGLVEKHEDVSMEMTGKCDGMLLEASHEVSARRLRRDDDIQTRDGSMPASIGL